MGHIPQEVIDQVRMRADIVDVINSYIPLKKMGRDFKACCPFHQEKTPSFVVNQQRQWYHCFGCGKHGNVISFVMERENVDFPNAVSILARKYQIYIPDESRFHNRTSGRDDPDLPSRRLQKTGVVEGFLRPPQQLGKIVFRHTPVRKNDSGRTDSRTGSGISVRDLQSSGALRKGEGGT